jgi:hypothetical protein
MNPNVLAEPPSVSSTPVEKNPGLSLPDKLHPRLMITEECTRASSERSMEDNNVHRASSPPNLPADPSRIHMSTFPPGFDSENVHVPWNVPSTNLPGFGIPRYSQGSTGGSQDVFVIRDPEDVPADTPSGTRTRGPHNEY